MAELVVELTDLMVPNLKLYQAHRRRFLIPTEFYTTFVSKKYFLNGELHIISVGPKNSGKV